MLEYKNYIGTVEFDPDTHALFGKIVNLDGLIMYNGASVIELEERMHEAVDNYLDHCKELGIDPRKPFSGKIALRVDPLQHARLAALAETRGDSMNKVIVDAIAQIVDLQPVDQAQQLEEIPTMKPMDLIAISKEEAAELMLDSQGIAKRQKK